MRSKIGKVVIDAAYGLQTSEQATEEERKIEEIVSNCQENEYNAVSYTHLTLPTTAGV